MTTTITKRSAADRGHTSFGWLNARHSFSFGEYRDPDHMGFRDLRVINDDRIAPGGGFPTHPHRDMEIITWVLEGELGHEDSLGSKHTIKPGELQLMSAGSGIRHSEMNASRTDPVHLLQIWIFPREKGLTPNYQQVEFDAAGRANKWQLLASPDGTDGSLVIQQDALLRVTDLAPTASLTVDVAPDRHAWVHVATGSITLDGDTYKEGDAFSVSGEGSIEIIAMDGAQVLWFDLA